MTTEKNVSIFHHYVPKWYQHRFLGAGQYKFDYYLDLNPEIAFIRNGKPIFQKSQLPWGPDKCFGEDYLYTSREFLTADEMEKQFFGPIDHFGAKGLPIVVESSWETHGTDCIDWLIEFFDALKLRTPKGMDWLFEQASAQADIQKNLRVHTQLQLKREISLAALQQFRHLNITTWWEGVWEIVTCNKSSVKFICSDHPVTSYNPAFFPMAQNMRYPNEPSILLRGTRTLIPLGKDECLIISNLEYAREPGKKITIPRTNARHFGETKMFDIRGIIRGRDLTSDEVTAINFIIKRRAKRYIAAAQPDWLYPEKTIKDRRWSNLDSILLPDMTEVAFHYGGEFFWGDDGKITGADELGRPLTRERIEEAHRSFRKMKIQLNERDRES